MNIVNLAALIGEIELGQLQLGERIVKQLNNASDRGEIFTLSNNGFDIEEILLTMDPDLKIILTGLNVVSSIELNVVICNLTEIRTNIQFRGEIADRNPNRWIGLLSFILVFISVYEVFIFSFDYTDKHGKMDGIVYNLIIKVASMLGSIIAWI